jgi:signal transduction histidine kinase
MNKLGNGLIRMEDSIIKNIYISTMRFLEQYTVEHTFAMVVDEAIRLVDAEYGSILLDQESQLVRVFASNPQAYKTQIRKGANTYKAFKTGKPILATIEEMQKAHPELIKFGVRSTLFIPLSNRGKPIGVLTVNSKKDRDFSEHELYVMQLFGSMASLAIRKNQLYEETKKALETRDMFISMAAHELRTPLTAIHGYGQLLQKKLTQTGSNEARWAQSLTNESTRLMILVNDLLEINRIRMGQLNYNWKQCDLNEILERVVTNFPIRFADYKLNYKNNIKDGDYSVIGDYHKLLQVIDNVLDNAVKFSARGSKIDLKLSSSAKLLKVVITDRGKGIKKEDLEKVYERYFRGNNHLVEGMGLGLYLTKNIVTQHHGSVQIKSKENIGTSVIIHLPKGKA